MEYCLAFEAPGPFTVYRWSVKTIIIPVWLCGRAINVQQAEHDQSETGSEWCCRKQSSSMEFPRLLHSLFCFLSHVHVCMYTIQYTIYDTGRLLLCLQLHNAFGSYPMVCTMSNPIVTDKWAGNFNCYSCQRKRLMADEFSKKVLHLQWHVPPLWLIASKPHTSNLEFPNLIMIIIK